MSLKAQVEELEEVKRLDVCLEKEKLKYDACLEELKREKDERMKELSGSFELGLNLTLFNLIPGQLLHPLILFSLKFL